MSLAKYEVFLTVVELGSLTKAGEALQLTQSAVSYSISNLEMELGFPLLIRTRTGVSLTENGERILIYIRKILHWEEKMRQEAATINGLAVGTIRIGAFTSICTSWLPLLIKEFKQDYPSIEIKILQGGYQDIEEWIIRGEVDFGFVSLPTQDVFKTIPIKIDPLICIFSKNHPFNKQQKVRLEQLENEPFIVQKSGYDNDIRRIVKETKCTFNIAFEMADDQAIIAMVENNLGVSIIPTLVLQNSPRHVSFSPLEPAQFRMIAIGAISLKELSPAAKEFIEYLKKMVI
ncbi:LysR family transcriptional regulator [Paenibacillus jamilae]|uniref:LysR family transcriptional regulator n=1 Tax=Paenibacillus jamilae TaxID=114136 RepID=UPI003D2C4CC9